MIPHRLASRFFLVEITPFWLALSPLFQLKHHFIWLARLVSCPLTLKPAFFRPSLIGRAV